MPINITRYPDGRLVNGEASQVLARLRSHSVDLVLTDPPYLVNYQDRSGRKIQNDCSAEWLTPVFSEVYRVLKPNRYCLSFYGWTQVEKFMLCWKQLGLYPVGHLVFHKPYASKVGLLAARHESAYLLQKGKPEKPQQILNDVLPWSYSGNHWHPTQKPVSSIQKLMETFSHVGDLVLDPFAGSATTGLVAHQINRRFLCIEKDPEYYQLARQRLTLTYAGE